MVILLSILLLVVVALEVAAVLVKEWAAVVLVGSLLEVLRYQPHHILLL